MCEIGGRGLSSAITCSTAKDRIFYFIFSLSLTNEMVSYNNSGSFLSDCTLGETETDNINQMVTIIIEVKVIKPDFKPNYKS
jgi:hypothetical protein